jgi:PAS domain S-box-containing protein
MNGGTTDSDIHAAFFSTVGTPISRLAPTGTVDFANAAWRAQFGPDASRPGTRFVDLLAKADALRAEGLLRDAAKGSPVTFEATLHADVPGGEAHTMRFQATRNESGAIFVVGMPGPPPGAARPKSGATRDDLDAMREQLGLMESENATLKMFARILETAPLALWSIDGTGTFTMAEGRGLKHHGTEPGLWVGLNALEMFHDQPEMAGAIVRALGGDDARVVTTPSPDVHFENWFMPLRHKGEVYGAMGFAIDATERVRSERALRDQLTLIERQSATIRALATPIIKIWDDILCLPIIGTVDSARTAEMTQGLLQSISREQARYAIVDLTGVEVVDTATADHLIQLFRSAQVLGVEGILCGIRPAVAQTVVALGLELGSVRTMRTLRDALRWCIRARRIADA